MTSSKTISPSQNSLAEFVTSVINLLEDIDKSAENKEFGPEKFKADLNALGICLKSEASKFSLAFKPPVIEENSSSCEMFLNRLAQLTLICKCVPLKHGKIFRDEILSSSKKVLKASIGLANSFLDTPIPFENDFKKLNIGSLNEKSEFLTSTGILWNDCDGLKQLSKNNKEASQKKWSELLIQLEDVISEMQDLLGDSTAHHENTNHNLTDQAESYDSDDSGDLHGLDTQPLTSEQLVVVKKVLSLLKISRLLFIKISKRSVADCELEKEKVPEWLDQLVEQAENICELVDELGASLWERENQDEIKNVVSRIIPDINNLLNLARSKSDPIHESWFGSCTKQVASLEKSLIEEAENW